jgi:3-methyladenine DNA glycosylase/8-oxoguanine DNA glycosylase
VSAASDDAALLRVVPVRGPLDLRTTLGLLVRGRGDRTARLGPAGFERATRTPDGPASEAIRVVAGGIEVRAWGLGAGWIVEAAPALVGADDDPEILAPLVAGEPRLDRLRRRFAGLRIGRTGAILEALVPAIVEQKVTGAGARRGLEGLTRTYGEPAPGPLGLWLPPAPATLAALPYHAFHPFGIERRRAETIRRAALEASRLEALATASPATATARLVAIRGIGAWTAAEVVARALGDPDAVSVGDFHLPNLVAWALAGEPRGDDARMLELLEPYRGQRGRVIRLLEASGIRAPAYGPRLAARRIERD